MAVFVIHKISRYADWHVTDAPRWLFVASMILISILFYRIIVAKYSAATTIAAMLQFFYMIAPVIIVLVIGLNQTRHIHWTIHLFAGGIVIAYTLTAIYRYHKNNFTQKKQYDKSTKKTENGNSRWLYGTLLLTMITMGFFALSQLREQANVDEPLWAFERIEKLWTNIAQHDWYNARPSDKPGVTTAAIAGTALLWTDSQTYAKNIPRDLSHDVADLYYAFRLPLVLFAIMTVPLLFFLLRKLTNPRTALIAIALIATSPLLIGIIRVINPDGLLWIFTTLVLLSYLCFYKKQHAHYLYLTGFFLGCAILTKYVANIFLIFLFLSIFILPLAKNEQLNKTLIRKRLDYYVIIVGITLITIYLLFPAVWLEHSRLLKATLLSEAFETVWIPFTLIVSAIYINVFFFRGTATLWLFTTTQKYIRALMITIIAVCLSSIAIVIVNIFGTHDLLLGFNAIFASPKSAHQFASAFTIFVSGFYPLIFGSLPLIVIGAITAYILMLKDLLHTRYKDLSPFLLHYYNIVTLFSLFIVMYYVGSAVQGVAPTVRYQITLYPIFAIIGTIGFAILGQKIITRCKIPTIHTYYLFAICFVIFILLPLYTLYTIKPHYLSYNNVFLPQRHIINWKDMGDGSYEAAQWLNALPRASQLTIWSDKNGVCAYFIGTCKDGVSNEALLSGDLQFDYYVISHARRERTVNLVTPRLRYDNPFPYKFNLLYDAEEHRAAWFIHPAKRDGNYVRIIDGTIIDITNTFTPTR